MIGSDNLTRNHNEASPCSGKPSSDRPARPQNSATHPQRETAASEENMELVLRRSSHEPQIRSRVPAGVKSLFKARSSSENLRGNPGPNAGRHSAVPLASPHTALNCGLNQAQNLDSAGSADSALCVQAATVEDLPTGKLQPPTDDQIHTLIAERLACFRTQKNFATRESFATENRGACERDAKCLNRNKGNADGMRPEPNDHLAESASENLSSESHQNATDVVSTCSTHQGDDSSKNVDFNTAENRECAFPKETIRDKDSEDSCDTDDSCDYPTASEHNYLTVSKHLIPSLRYSKDDNPEGSYRRRPKSRKPKNLVRTHKHAGSINAQPEASSVAYDSNEVLILDSSEDELMNEPIAVGRIVISDSDTDEKEQRCKPSKRKKMIS